MNLRTQSFRDTNLKADRKYKYVCMNSIGEPGVLSYDLSRKAEGGVALMQTHNHVCLTVRTQSFTKNNNKKKTLGLK